MFFVHLSTINVTPNKLVHATGIIFLNFSDDSFENEPEQLGFYEFSRINHVLLSMIIS